MYARKIPRKNRLKRIPGSTSFKATGTGEYTLKRHGIKETLRATTQHTPKYGSPTITVEFKNQDGLTAAIFDIVQGAGTEFAHVHRRVTNQYRGYNLGKVGLRLIEQAAKKQGATTLGLDSSQLDTIKTALWLGYKIAPEDENTFRIFLGLKKGQTLTREQMNQRLTILLKKIARKEIALTDVPFIRMDRKIQ